MQLSSTVSWVVDAAGEAPGADWLLAGARGASGRGWPAARGRRPDTGRAAPADRSAHLAPVGRERGSDRSLGVCGVRARGARHADGGSISRSHAPVRVFAGNLADLQLAAPRARVRA